MERAVRITRGDEAAYRAWRPALPVCRLIEESWEEAVEAIQQAVGRYLASLDVAEAMFRPAAAPANG